MKIALVGIGKIATDQHVPSIRNSPDWELAATVSRKGHVEGVMAFSDMSEMLSDRPDIPVVSLCLPPAPRFDYAKSALQAGRHVMLEKPPGTSIAECDALRELALENGVSIFATWHSREAENVDKARDWLADKTITRARVTWRESIWKWHPGQDWVFEPGGMGVFDPGINALSILTAILPDPIDLTEAVLEYPANCQEPIAARLKFGGHISAEFDWRERKEDVWTIEVDTDQGSLQLLDGGGRISINGSPPAAARAALHGEYPRLYAKMAALVARGGIDMDLAPLALVMDAYKIGERRTVDAFAWD